MYPLVGILILLPVAAATAAPCTTATSDCSEWIGLNGSARSLVYRSHPLSAKNDRISRALVIVHGQGRNGDGYFRTGMAAAFLAGALEDTIVVSPRFASNQGSCQDKLEANEINWRCSGDSWRSGAPALNFEKLTSYDLGDAILRRLADKTVFPNLKAIVLTGHSAGGQYVSRYGMANQVHEKLGVPVTYVVSNPSSYAWPDAMRPRDDGAVGEYREGRNCTTFNEWPYGFVRRVGYTARIPEERLKKQLAERPVVYLLGELDTLPIAGFDSSCPAMAQGPTRLARGQAFARHLAEKYGARHTVAIAPMCGHNARCVYTTDTALAILFPKP
jgi:hypothetical protein